MDGEMEGVELNRLGFLIVLDGRMMTMIMVLIWGGASSLMKGKLR